MNRNAASRARPRKAGPRDWVGRFSAWRFGPGPGASFIATKLRPGAIEGGRVVFSAATGSSTGPIDIFRRARILAPAAAFRVPEPDTYPEHVIFTPPAPFSGTGTFARTPESTFTWEGGLSIQFPGIDPLPLTGPRFETFYCALRGCATQSSESESPVAAPTG